jgi:hypothetical protein
MSYSQVNFFPTSVIATTAGWTDSMLWPMYLPNPELYPESNALLLKRTIPIPIILELWNAIWNFSQVCEFRIGFGGLRISRSGLRPKRKGVSFLRTRSPTANEVRYFQEYDGWRTGPDCTACGICQTGLDQTPAHTSTGGSGGNLVSKLETKGTFQQNDRRD